MRLLALDIETTGLSPTNNQVLTIGLLLVEIRRETYEVIDSEHIKIKHDEYKVSGLALKINKINLDEHHEQGIEVMEAIKVMEKFIKKHKLKNCTLLGHNLRFDLSFLVEMHERQGKKFDFFIDYIDTMHVWRDLRTRGHIPAHYKASLKVLAKFFNVDRTGAHDALVDCKITTEVFCNLKEFTDRLEEEIEI